MPVPPRACPRRGAGRPHHVFAAGISTLLLSIACSPSEAPPPPLLEIPVVEVIQRDQPITMEMVGQTLGSSDIPIRARVEGELIGMHFVEGNSVERGQLLYEIDPVPYESKVVEARGSLAQATTRLANAESDLNRIRPLAEMNAVSQSDLDGAVARFEAARGALQSAEARVEQAEIQLGYTRIRSPISGRVGITAARVGEFVGKEPNPVVLNFVSKVDPIRVRFSIDERTYIFLSRRLAELRETTGEPTRAGEGLELILADRTTHPYRGRAVAADAAVDPQTGTFTYEADFPNPDGFVLAGQFARVRAVAEVREGALLVPSRSISELQGQFRVYVVKPDGAVELRPVDIGPAIENLRIIESGLAPGERVALEIMRLRPGMQIESVLVRLDADGNRMASDRESEDTGT